MITNVVAGILSALIAPRIEAAVRRPTRKRPTVDWATQPWRRLR